MDSDAKIAVEQMSGLVIPTESVSVENLEILERLRLSNASRR
jgi:hypothetical protein